MIARSNFLFYRRIAISEGIHIIYAFICFIILVDKVSIEGILLWKVGLEGYANVFRKLPYILLFFAIIIHFTFNPKKHSRIPLIRLLRNFPGIRSILIIIFFFIFLAIADLKPFASIDYIDVEINDFSPLHQIVRKIEKESQIKLAWRQGDSRIYFKKSARKLILENLKKYNLGLGKK